MTRVNINSREWNQSFNWSCRHMQRPQKEQLTPTHFTCAQALTRSRCDILYIYSVMQQIRDYVCCMRFSNNSDQVRFLKMMRHTTEAPEIESFALPATYGHYWLFHRAFSNQQWTQTSIGTIWITYNQLTSLVFESHFSSNAMSWWTMFGCRALHEGRLSMMLDVKTPGAGKYVDGYSQWVGTNWVLDTFGLTSGSQAYKSRFHRINIYLLESS